jgi:hypothetical protein
MSKKFGIQTKGTGRAVMQGGGTARRDMRSGYYPNDMGMRGGAMYNTGGRVGLRDRAFAKGGKVGKKSQGYKAREDESLGMRTGKESGKKQSMKARRDESYGKWGKRKAGRVNKAKGGRINTSRENRLEELGRVDAEKSNKNRRAEKRRIVRELKK